MKNSKNMKNFLTIISENNKYRLILIFLLMLMIAALDLLMPQITRLILDNAIKFKKVKFLISLVFTYGFISIFSSLTNILLDYVCCNMKKKISIKLKVKLLRHLSRLSGDYYTNIKTGNILSTIEHDMFTVENLGAELLFSLIIDVITASIALFLLIKMDLDLLIVVILLQFIITFSQYIFTKIISKKTAEFREADGDLSNIIQEYVSNIMNIIISKSSFNFFKRYISKERDLIKNEIKLDMIISSNVAIARILSNLIIIFIYGFGGWKIIEGSMTIGELIVFQQYTGMLIGPCMRIIKSNTRIQQSLVSINRIFSILDEPILINQNNTGNMHIDEFNGDIVFNSVSFSYNHDKTIDNLNMRFKKGDITAIVGSSGCGKSTIVNLIFRLWDTDKGEIIIDNKNIKDYNLKALRKNISIVTQDLLLFDDSILENLTLGNKSIHIDYVKEICGKVGISKFINELPNGLDTIIGEKGVKLSGGQKQRIAIARSILSDSSIIIFDEATSALDNISQRNILENITGLLKNKTIIVIAHRLSTVRSADKIYVMDKGKVIEEGSHEELILNESSYYSLLNEKTLDVAIN